TVTATFTQDVYSLTVVTVGSGVVTPVNGSSYLSGTVVNLTAVASPGWSFGSWSGAVGSGVLASVNMTGNLTVTATFTQDVYSLTVVTVGTGKVFLGNRTYLSWTNVSLSAFAGAGWSFGGWSGDVNGMTNPTTLVMDGNKTVTVTFTQDIYTLTMVTVGKGTVSPGNQSYLSGTSVDLKAMNDEGWIFSGWRGDVLGSINLTITMNGNTTVTAVFVQDRYTLTMITVGHGTVSPGNQTYLSGTNVNLKALNAAGWSFNGWSGDAAGAVNTTILMDANKVVTATFTQDSYTLTMITVGDGSVLPGNQTYLSGTNVDLKAIPASDWYFSGWNGAASGTANTTITMTGNLTVTATFTQIQYAVSFSQSGIETDYSGAILNVDGANYTASAFPLTFTWDSGSEHTFAYLSPLSVGDGKQYVWASTTGLSTLQSGTLTVTGNGTVSGNFSIQYYLTVTSSHGTTGGSGWYPAGTYAQASVDAATVSLDEGTRFVFNAWSGDAAGSEITSNNILMDNPKTATAEWTTEYYLTVSSAHGQTGGEGWYSAGTTAYATLDSDSVAETTGTRHLFTSWSADAAGTNYAQSEGIIMNSAKTAVAAWTTQYYLTVNSVYGSPTGEGWYDSGSTASFGVTTPVLGDAGTRYSLTSWASVSSGGYSGTASSNSVVMNNPVTETAQWQTQYQVIFDVNPSGAGVVTPSGSNEWVNAGTLSISAVANSGYTFTSWTTTGAITVATASSAATTATISGSGTIVANFNPVTFTVSASAGANGSISPAGDTTVNYGDSQSFTITPNAGYHIVDVQVDGVSVGAVASYSFNSVNASHTISASFTINTYTVTVTSEHGSPTPSGQVTYGSNFTAQVTSPEAIDETHQWVCTGYSVDGGTLVEGTSYTFTNIHADHTIVFSWESGIVITPTIVTESTNGTEIVEGTPFTFTLQGNISITQISNPTLVINETANTVTLSLNLTGTTGTTGFSNMTIPKSTMPTGVVPIPTVYIDGQIAENQGYTEDAENFYIWYTTHFSNHQVAVVFPASASPTPTPPSSPITSPSTTSPSPQQTSSTEPSPTTAPPQNDSGLLILVLGITVAAIFVIAIFIAVKKRGQNKE
ncbi:MAG: hypothetical protein NWF05_01590, partial [Candidatus Bathyarchaeota archaeon]|nr:hypothetical protein [Candidatus Bathyarchaeota archaeon]